MNTTVLARLIGMVVTLFILILTVKSELLEYYTIKRFRIIELPFVPKSLIDNLEKLGT